MTSTAAAGPLHPTDYVHAEPIRTSPLIRLSRWTLLGLGIAWGYYRYRQLCHRHADIREREAKVYIHRVQDAEDKLKMKVRKEVEQLSKLASVNQEDAKVVFDAAHNYPYNKE